MASATRWWSMTSVRTVTIHGHWKTHENAHLGTMVLTCWWCCASGRAATGRMRYAFDRPGTKHTCLFRLPDENYPPTVYARSSCFIDSSRRRRRPRAHVTGPKSRTFERHTSHPLHSGRYVAARSRGAA